ncbi:unnamed protein product [Prunus armeniaca]
MKKYGYHQDNSDHTLFIKRMDDNITLLIIYVDDMLVTGDVVVEIGKLQKYLASKFEMKELGALKYFMGIEVCTSRNPYCAKSLLAIYPDQVSTNKERYQSDNHLAVVIRILSYLKKAPGGGLIFRKLGHLDVKVSKKNVVVRSSAKAEYRGISQGVCELFWLRILLSEIGFPPKKVMELYCDNQATRDIANNQVQHNITKHVEVDMHYIKKKLVNKLIDIPFVKSEEHLADVLTHVVSTKIFHVSLDKLDI